MCDASDFAIGAVLGQQKGKVFHVIYYASKVLNDAQLNYATTEKELRPYYNLANKYGFEVFSIIVENRHNGIDEHNVPEETLEKMRNRFDIKL